jgi:hypothetical protein
MGGKVISNNLYSDIKVATDEESIGETKMC